MTHDYYSVLLRAYVPVEVGYQSLRQFTVQSLSNLARSSLSLSVCGKEPGYEGKA